MATWHLGRLKRVFLVGTLIFVMGFVCWMLEELGAVGCGPVTLHSMWHVCSSHALMAWTAFLKYHRGLLFGFRPELRGWWWCPFTVWHEPTDPELNPIIRHTRGMRGQQTDAPTESPAPSAADGVRNRRRRFQNSYLMPKVRLKTSAPSTAGSSMRRLWRGASLHGDALEWISLGSSRSSCNRRSRATVPARQSLDLTSSKGDTAQLSRPELVQTVCIAMRDSI